MLQKLSSYRGEEKEEKEAFLYSKISKVGNFRVKLGTATRVPYFGNFVCSNIVALSALITDFQRFFLALSY